MMHLLNGELKKVFAHRFLVVLLLLLLLFNVVMIWRTSYPENIYGPYVSAMLESYIADPEGFLEKVKAQEEYLNTIDTLQDEHYNAEKKWKKEHPGEEYPVPYPVEIPLFVQGEHLSDEKAIAQFYDIINRAEIVHASKDSVIERAKAFYSFYQSRSGTNSFAARYQVSLANSYISEDRNAVTYPIEYGYGWDNYLTYGGDSVFLLLAAVLLGAVILLPERSGGFATVLRVSKRGRSYTMLAKGTVCLLLSFGLSLLFSAVTIATFWGKYGLEGAALPLQSFFPNAILHLQIWQAVLIRVLFRALATFCVMMLCVLLSVFLKSTLAVYLCGGGIIVAFYVFSQLQLFHEHSPLHLFNLFTMLSGTAYFECWNAVSIFGLCADYSVALPIVLIGTGVLLLLVSTISFSLLRITGYRRNRLGTWFAVLFAACSKRWEEIRRKKGGNIRTHTLGLSAYEWRKLLGGFLPILICVAFLTLGAHSTYQNLVLPKTFEENLTREYMDVLEGEITEEKRQYIADLRQKTNSIRGQYAEMAEGFQNGSVDYDTYTSYIAAYNDATDKLPVVEQLNMKLDHIDALAMEGKNVHFVFEVGWQRILSCPVDYYLAAFLILILSGIYAFENRHNFSIILYSTKNGRLKTTGTKLRITLLLSFLAGLASVAYRLILVETTIGLSSVRSPAASIEAYQDFGGSLLQLLLLSGLLRIVGAIVLGLLCFSLSSLFGKSLPVITIAACSVFVVPLLHVFDVTVMDDVMLNGILGGISPIVSTAGLISAIVWSSVSILLLIVSFYKVQKA